MNQYLLFEKKEIKCLIISVDFCLILMYYYLFSCCLDFKWMRDKADNNRSCWLSENLLYWNIQNLPTTRLLVEELTENLFSFRRCANLVATYCRKVYTKMSRFPNNSFTDIRFDNNSNNNNTDTQTQTHTPIYIYIYIYMYQGHFF